MIHDRSHTIGPRCSLRRARLALPLLLPIFLESGCALMRPPPSSPGNVAAAPVPEQLLYARPAPERGSCLLILPFDNKSDVPGLGKAAAGIVTKAIDESPWFTAIETDALSRRLQELDAGVSIANLALAKTVGELVGAHAVVHGTVSGSWRDNNAHRMLLIDGRLVSVRAPDILWAGSIVVTAKSPEETPQASLERALQTLTQHLVSTVRPLRAVAANACFAPIRDAETARAQARKSPTADAQRAPPTEKSDPVVETKPPLTAAIPEPPPPIPASEIPLPASNLDPAEEELLGTLEKGEALWLRGVTYKKRDAAKPQVDEPNLPLLGNILRARPNINIEVRVHTDPGRNARADKKLTDKQARTFRDYLLKLWEIPSKRIESQGMGSAHPVMPNISKRSREMNRRVEITKK